MMCIYDPDKENYYEHSLRPVIYFIHTTLRLSDGTDVAMHSASRLELGKTILLPFWPTVLSVAPLAHCVVCLSVCLSVVCRL